MKLRTEEFRLFTMHGVVQPPQNSEERIRNGLFMAGSLNLVLSNLVSFKIRLVAYEMPLEPDTTSGRRIDLFGYDQEGNPCIIELKNGDATDTIADVINQINMYESMLRPILGHVEKEIKRKLFLDEFKLTRQIKKIVIAPASYYSEEPNKDWKPYINQGVIFCYLRKDKNLNSLVEEVVGEDGISVYVHNKGLLLSQH